MERRAVVFEERDRLQHLMRKKGELPAGWIKP